MRKRTSSKPAPKSSISTWHLVSIAVLVFITYANAIGANFVWDDELQIVKNGQIRDLSQAGNAFASAFWSFADPELGARTNFYRPVQTLVYMLAYQIGGLSPWPYHLLNIILHALASTILYLVCREYGVSATASFLATCIFVVHPIHAEAVTWNAGTPDASCAVFYFGSILFVLKYLNSGNRKYPLLAGLAFLGACFSKEMAVTLPVVALLLVLAKGRPTGSAVRDALFSLWPIFAGGVVYIAARMAALGFLTTTHFQLEATPLDWFTLGIRVLGQYVHYALFPYPLTAYHLIPFHLSDRVPSTLIYALLIAMVSFIIFKLNRQFPRVALWSVIFLVMLVPVFNFKGISLTFFAERYLYIPTMALAVISGLLLEKADRRMRAGAVALIAVFCVLTLIRNQDWKSDQTLYESILRVHPEVAHIRNNLADVYLKQGDNARARNYLESALQSLDSGVYVQSDEERYRAYVGLGAVAARLQNFAEAKEQLGKALKIKPRGDWAYLYLGGVIMEGEGDYAMALANFQKAIELGPTNEVARDYMGIAFFNMKRYPEAIRYFREALAINPTYKDAETHLGMAMQAAGS